jgi:uncharacterized protein RhaS with RHS repeats
MCRRAWITGERVFIDSDLGRFLSVDPLAEKYASISPYAYVANNPIIFIDPDGMQIEPSLSYNSRGQAVITLNVTGKILDVSGNWFSGASAIANNMQSRGEAISGNLVNTSKLGIRDSKGKVINKAILNFNIHFERVNSISEVNENDHLIVLASFNYDNYGMKKGGAYGITNMSGGRVMHIDAKRALGLADWMRGSGTTTAMHELLAHCMDAVSYKPEDNGTYVYEYGNNKGTKFTSEQGRTILKKLFSGKLNKGPVYSFMHGYKLPYTGWHLNNGDQGNIFDRRVGVKREKYLKNAFE